MKTIFTIIYIAFSINLNAQCWDKITNGGSHTLSIKTDGTLWAWGNNSRGQIGDGTTTNKNVPTQIGSATNWSQISAGSFFSLAIKTDGTLWAWGGNGDGQLGDGTNIDRYIPTQIGTATNWNQISAGAYFSLGLKTDGTLWAWGDNYAGQIGDGTTTNKNAPTQVGLATDWNQISAGSYFALAKKTDGTLWSWGDNTDGQLGNGSSGTISKLPAQVGSSSSWSLISAGRYFTLAKKTDGTLWAWGRNNAGQLGDGTITDRDEPTQIGTATNWSQINAGNTYNLTLKTDGTLWAWGDNTYGQLGDGTNTDRNIPTQIGTATNWAQINASDGDGHSLSIKADGTLWAWGYNYFGQLGNGTLIDKNVPSAISSIGCLVTAIIEEGSHQNPIFIYPNPTKNIIKFSIPSDAKITSLLGQIVMINKNVTEFDLSGLTNGIYLLTLTDKNGEFIQCNKIVKE